MHNRTHPQEVEGPKDLLGRQLLVAVVIVVDHICCLAMPHSGEVVAP